MSVYRRLLAAQARARIASAVRETGLIGECDRFIEETPPGKDEELVRLARELRGAALALLRNVDGGTPGKLPDAEASKVRDGVCPDCGRHLREGPHGGLSVNWLCPNGHVFNDMQVFGVERIKP